MAGNKNTKPKLSIATTDDAQELADFVREHYNPNLPIANGDGGRELIHKGIRGGGWLLAIARNPEVVGVYGARQSYFHPRLLELHVAFVHPDARGDKISKKLREDYLTPELDKLEGFDYVMGESVLNLLAQRIQRGSMVLGAEFGVWYDDEGELSTLLIARQGMQIAKNQLSVYIPEDQKELVGLIYENVGAERDIQYDNNSETYDLGEHDSIRITHREKEKIIRQLGLIDMTSELAPARIRHLESQGFYFCGVLPEVDGRDLAVMRYHDKSLDIKRETFEVQPFLENGGRILELALANYDEANS